MLINRKCEHCNEPSKRVVGFWERTDSYTIVKMENAEYDN